MSDNKRWFKVWTSILSDDDFDPRRKGTLESIGRFALLGAYTALHGRKGQVEIMPDSLFGLMQVRNLDELKRNLTLKNVQFEEGKNRYGKTSVTWEKWHTFQEDSTAAERMKSLRSKRRGEERRKEEKRVPPLAPQKGGRSQTALQVLVDWLIMEFTPYKPGAPQDKKAVSQYYAHNVRAASAILNYAREDVETAKRGVKAVSERLGGWDRDYSLNAIARWFPDWFSNPEGYENATRKESRSS